ncbi:uncharacterized protein LOC142742455 [Rhinoderma darwinii]|uniref:uncharacterized protein LOC142742455 n=1 Tax=Rhinoderma darwinii TaxID=43563 RepID=UPI003F672AA7
MSTDPMTHQRHVRQVLLRLRENRLYAKLEKCVFERNALPFLGYIISDQGLKMDPEKVKAVLEWLRPQSLRSIQRFLGFANFYRQLISNFSLTSPISTLTKKGMNAKVWTPEVDSAFNSLKSAFTSASILHHPDVSRQFSLEVDASSVGAGVLLFQRGSKGKTMVCGYYSKVFSSTVPVFPFLLPVSRAVQNQGPYRVGVELR